MVNGILDKTDLDDLTARMAAVEARVATLEGQPVEPPPVVVPPVDPPPPIGDVMTLAGQVDYVTLALDGTLRFDPATDTTLRVARLHILKGGRIEAKPNPGVRHQIVIADQPGDVGVLIEGAVEIQGPDIGEPFIRLAAAPRAGESVLVLEADATWKPGDKLLIPDSRQGIDGPRESWDEYARLATAEGRTLTLEAPLKFDHPGNSISGEMPHAVNMSRPGVTIRSENMRGNRGCVTFRGATGTVQNCHFGGLGRTTLDPASEPDRFPVLIERCDSLTFKNNVVTCPLDPMQQIWGITVRNCTGGLVEGNVSHNWAGANIAVINSDGVTFRGNFAHKVNGTWQRGDVNPGREGVGYWISNSNGCRFVDNVACQTGMYGWTIWHGGPFRQFERNEVYATRRAWTAWHINAIDTNSEQLDAPASEVVDLSGWNCWDIGLGLLYPIGNVTFRGLRLHGESGAQWGVDPGDYKMVRFKLDRPVIKGYRFGIKAPVVYGPEGVAIIDHPELANREADIAVMTQGIPGGGGWKVQDRELRIISPQFGAPVGVSMWHNTVESSDLTKRDVIRVLDYEGADWRLYYEAQRAVAYGGELAPAEAVGVPWCAGGVAVKQAEAVR